MGIMLQYQDGWTMHFIALKNKERMDKVRDKANAIAIREKMYWAMIASRKRVKKAWDQTTTAKSLIDDAVKEVVNEQCISANILQ